MNNNNIPDKSQLPSVAKLIKSTILAIVISALILVTIVLPAEYGLDPTGVGKLVGLTKMGEIKTSLAEEAKLEESALAAQIQQPDDQPVQTENSSSAELSETKSELKREITLDPNQGKEIKLTMKAGDKVEYLWYTDSGQANFDSHADSKALAIKYHNYEKGKLARSEGTLEAAFDGNHGWFWRNRTSEKMIITLEVSGVYSDIVEY